MPQTAFIVRPFGRKPFRMPSTGPQKDRFALLLRHQLEAAQKGGPTLVSQPDGPDSSEILIDFDAIEAVLLQPALRGARLQGETTGAVIEAGNIREEMFNRLITADLVLADVSMANPNVYYELGLRQAFRDKFTFVIRCNLDPYPFDLQTDRYFEYDLLQLLNNAEPVQHRLQEALRQTLNQYRSDSPVFKMLPKLESEDPSRFIAVPEDFREEVERALRERQPEDLGLLALECERHLWEIEGLRAVGRAQFEANFIEGAKETWQRIAARYPDDAEANTVLSTVYQRLDDRTRSEQALARVTRSRTLSPQRLSELRGLNGRNLKAAWMAYWRKGEGRDERRRRALSSPLLQRAIDAYLEAFKTDLNNSYAGLNALTLMVMQAELIDDMPELWARLQRHKDDGTREFSERVRLIDRIAQSLLLALEADRERLANRGKGDPWFTMLEAAVMCTLSSQPSFVAQLYAQARYDAPPKSDESMKAALLMYRELGIQGKIERKPTPALLGTLGENVTAALEALQEREDGETGPRQPKRLLVFIGLRVDDSAPAAAAPAGESRQTLFPARLTDAVRELIRATVTGVLNGSDPADVLAMAGGASGGDILFHEVCRDLQVSALMFLPLPKPQHIGTYVSPAGSTWTSRFATTHADLLARARVGVGDSAANGSADGAQNAATAPAAAEGGPSASSTTRESASRSRIPCGVKVFSEAADLPRWLQGTDHYNVGRRSMLWMLQHAHVMANGIGSDIETTLIALRPRRRDDGSARRGFGGITEAIRLAQMNGVRVIELDMPEEPGRPRRPEADDVGDPPPRPGGTDPTLRGPGAESRPRMPTRQTRQAASSPDGLASGPNGSKPSPVISTNGAR